MVESRPPRVPFKKILFIELSILLLALGGCIYSYTFINIDVPPAPKPTKQSYTVAAVGDIACSPSDPDFNASSSDITKCQMQATANLVDRVGPSAVLALGDLQYETGKYTSFASAYDKSWGKFKSITYPVPGNHEYETANASGYYQYFADFNQKSGVSGNPDQGYYSFNIGDWHLIGLNSNCSQVPCSLGSEQYKWLEQDLEQAQSYQCSLAFWHHPRFTSGQHNKPSETNRSQDFWNLLSRYQADVVLNGHDHIYERFSAQNGSGQADEQNGITQFTAGTGGKTLYSLQTPRTSNSQFALDSSFGILKLTLSDGNYTWEFINTAGAVLDSGTSTCH